jgi:N-acetylmuramoyl-L-alanine amidase
LKYTLRIEQGAEQTGTTDEEGCILTQVPVLARRARLTVHEEDGPETYELSLGYLDPLEELRGIQQRLCNLGIPCPVSGELDDETRWAIQYFQSHVDGLELNGDPEDPAMLKALLDRHGS